MAAKVTFMPSNQTVCVNPGTTIMQAARKAGVHIRSRCGHQAGCLMCKITVDQSHSVTDKTEKERRKLGSGAERLACQTKVLEHVTVYVPEDPYRRAIRLQLEKKEKGEDHS